MDKKIKIEGMQGVILDMDGVITQTARIHRESWKKMFNGFLEKQDKVYDPITDEDYFTFIDGKPRYDGVKDFLESRDITLPYGNPQDPSDNITICGLGNRKNNIFLELIKNLGVDTYEDSVNQIKQWRKHGLKTAVVSSSKNCRQILETAEIDGLFDVRVDGVTLQEKGLKGKPEPDMFLEAARKLHLKPGTCVVFEDAISGVKAGYKGDFAFVVGVRHNGNKNDLYNNGADIVIQNLGELRLLDNPEIEPYFTQSLPSVFINRSKFNNLIEGKIPALFLDYDGTLTPIVKQPEDAILSEEMRDTLKQCASKFTVAIISGRDLDDVKNMVKLDNLIYAGSHGFRISGPNGLYMEHEKAGILVPELDHIEKELQRVFNEKIKGVKVERKRYAIAIHYRNVADDDIPLIKRRVNRMIADHPQFKKGEGKKIFEIKPDVQWHKGKAVNWILEELDLSDTQKIIPVYIGDDVTDEDAFKSISDKGIGILVGFHGKPSAAKYHLRNIYEVRNFLQLLADSSGV